MKRKGISNKTLARTENSSCHLKRFEHPKRLLQITQLIVQTANFGGIYLLALSLLLCTYVICDLGGADAEERKYLDVDEVLTKLEQAVVENPNSIETYLALGKTYLALSAMTKAEATFLHTIGLDSKFAEGYYWLGRVYYLQEKFEESRNTFQTAVELFPDWGEAYAELGLSYFRLHQYEASEKAYLKALSLMRENASHEIPPPSVNKGGAKRRGEIVAGISLLPLPLNENERQEWLANVTPLSEADVYYYLSLTFFKRGLLDEASTYCEKAILIEPFAEAYFQLGLVSVRKKQLKEAEEAFRQALSQKPTMAQAHYQLALLYSKRKRVTEAKKEMEIFQKLRRETEQFQKQREALVRSVDKASAFANLGLLYLNEQKYEEAAREYQKALWHNPDFAEAYNGLGHAYAMLGRFEEAIQAQQKAIELQPKMAEAYAGLGFTRMKQAELSQSEEDYRLAMAAYRKATELKPDFPEALQNLGNIALKLSLFPEAERAFESLLSLSLKEKKDKDKLREGINLAQVHLALGMVYLRQENFPKAVSHYQKALNYDPDLVSAYYNMGFIATKVGRKALAIEFYNEVLKRQPDMTEAHYLLGKIYAEQKKYVQAEESYQRAIEIEPTASYAYERLAHLYGVTLTPTLSQEEREQRLDKAIQFAQKAVELQPDSAAYLNTLSWLYYLRRDYAQAEQAIQKALSLQPDNPVYQEGLQIIQQARK
ncbi:TPA: tetratricopeptide repeat protein [Candidatus Poribacteria bacterium]|nr:tetratricopeptide repeat protein [Candidatus Poribacteria bacterium]